MNDDTINNHKNDSLWNGFTFSDF